jgi:hypothetical protein
MISDPISGKDRVVVRVLKVPYNRLCAVAMLKNRLPPGTRKG